jgi:hypothetical protein
MSISGENRKLGFSLAETRAGRAINAFCAAASFALPKLIILRLMARRFGPSAGTAFGRPSLT